MKASKLIKLLQEANEPDAEVVINGYDIGTVASIPMVRHTEHGLSSYEWDGGQELYEGDKRVRAFEIRRKI